MKLSDLVGFLNNLSDLSIDGSAAAVNADMKKIVDTIKRSGIELGTSTEGLITAKDRVDKFLQQFDQHLAQAILDLKNIIKQQDNDYIQASQILYNEGMQYDSTSHILNRKLDINPATEIYLRSRLQLYTDWKYPGLVIRPAHSPGLHDLVALDPMYFVDTSDELFEPVKSLFTANYQSRLRYYTIEEQNRNRLFFWNFPRDQFGFVYSFRFFNFKPLELVCHYMSEIHTLLRPGGVFLFGFNDCDYQGGVRLAENNFCSYTPGRLLLEHAEKVGYELIYRHYDEAGTSWLELKKPGTLSSIRGGQTLAQIWSKETASASSHVLNEKENNPNVLDIEPRNQYNELELLINFAKILELDISRAIVNGEYHVKKLRRIIAERMNTGNYPYEKIERLLNKRNKI